MTLTCRRYVHSVHLGVDMCITMQMVEQQPPPSKSILHLQPTLLHRVLSHVRLGTSSCLSALGWCHGANEAVCVG